MSNVLPLASLSSGSGRGHPEPVFFARNELEAVLALYGRMVAAGIWRDYSLDSAGDWVSFSAYRRATDVPDYRIIKEPALAKRQGAFRLVNNTGRILKRGHDVDQVLKPLQAKLLKLIED